MAIEYGNVNLNANQIHRSAHKNAEMNERFFHRFPFGPVAEINHYQIAQEMENDPALDYVQGSYIPKSVCEELARRKVNAELQALRLVNAGLQISPLPARTKMIVSSAANYIEDVALPSDAELVQFFAPSSVVFYVSFGARINFNGGTGVVESDPYNWNDFIVCPTNQWFYCKGKNQISIGIPVTGQVISVGML